MKLAVFSDIHANLQALTTALRAADALGADHLCCLGDVVGYGPDPTPCIELVRERCDVVVLGNHDVAVATGRALEALPKDGQVAAERHRAELSGDDIAWLEGLPLRTEAFGCTFVHATPDEPAAWSRLQGFHATRAQFAHFETDLCFIGHTHVPGVAAEKLGVQTVRPGGRYLINVGSVGQPRDGDPRLCLGLFDTEAVSYTLHRIPYDVEGAADRIRAEGLPASLADRVLSGR